jgi:outer membrane receptor for monomeric catechols
MIGWLEARRVHHDESNDLGAGATVRLTKRPMYKLTEKASWGAGARTELKRNHKDDGGGEAGEM